MNDPCSHSTMIHVNNPMVMAESVEIDVQSELSANDHDAFVLMVNVEVHFYSCNMCNVDASIDYSMLMDIVMILLLNALMVK